MDRQKELKNFLATGIGIYSCVLLWASAGWEGYIGHTTEMGHDLVVALIVTTNTIFLTRGGKVDEQIITGTVLTDLAQLTNIVNNYYYESDDLRTTLSTTARTMALPLSIMSQTLFLSN